MASRNSIKEYDYLQPSHWRRNIWNLIIYLMLIMGSLMFILPLFWALSSSFKSDYQVMQYPPQWIPSPLRWQNYPEALTYVPFGRFALNTLFIAAFAICGNILSCTIIAYGFAGLRAPGKNFFFIFMLSTVMLVEPVRIIPLYIEFDKLGWIDSFLPLIVPAFFGDCREYFYGLSLFRLIIIRR